MTQVRKKDTSLEKSLDLLEEGVRLANQCTELIDHADWDGRGGETAEPRRESAAEADGRGSRRGAPSDEAAADDAVGRGRRRADAPSRATPSTTRRGRPDDRGDDEPLVDGTYRGDARPAARSDASTRYYAGSARTHGSMRD